jgi:DNA-directed RNA polymerase subunit RPC12/RpoP
MKIACPKCGADVAFNPITGKCHCDYCGSDVDIDKFELNQYEKAKADEEASKATQESKSTGTQDDLYDEFHCSSCGAKLITDKTTTITHCVFCGSQQMIKQRLTGKFAPTECIPFKINHNQFVNIYKNFIGTKRLAPKSFKQNPGIYEIKGLYVPFYFFEYNIKSYERGMACFIKYNNRFFLEYESRTDGLIFVDGSLRLNDSLMSSVGPFYFGDIVPFNPAYLTGFQAEYTDDSEDVLRKKAEDKAVMYTARTVKSALAAGSSFLKGLRVCDLKEINKPKNILVPVWFLNCFYDGRKYSYLVNGQTGKVVGEVPIDKKKIVTAIVTYLSVCIVIGLAGAVLGLAAQNVDFFFIFTFFPGIFLGIVGVLLLAWLYLQSTEHKNITHTLDVGFPTKNFKLIRNDRYLSKGQYIKKFSKDELEKIEFKKYINGKYVCDMDIHKMVFDTRMITHSQTTINNKNL